jgi:LPXTG-site transpeptidase (sortase) family protein
VRAPRPAVVVLALCLGAAAAPLGGWLLSRPADSVGVRPGNTVGVRPAGPMVPTTDAPSAAAPRPVAPPTRVTIPSVGVDAPVVPVGVTADGEMRLPRDVHRVGWYRFGPRPGEGSGSVVLAAHVDSRTDGLGVFAALRRAAPGDRVTVVTADGRATYRVVSRELLAKSRLPLAELFRRDGREVLTLVTCGGQYLRDAGGYQDNLVVTAVPIGHRGGGGSG